MNYIVHTRFRGRAICGDVNLPAMTECTLEESTICYEGHPLCYVRSDNAHNHFARNDDGQGMTRGKIIRAIQNRLAKRDEQYQARWDKVWEDAVCQQYRRPEHQDHWLWNHAFFEAPIHDLQHIAGLVGAKVGVNG